MGGATTITPIQQILHQEPSPYMRPCPRCGVNIPTSIKGCWSCGEVLDPRLIELAKAAKESKP